MLTRVLTTSSGAMAMRVYSTTPANCHTGCSRNSMRAAMVIGAMINRISAATPVKPRLNASALVSAFLERRASSSAKPRGIQRVVPGLRR